jgi:flagellar basal body-associated protein FliL
MAGTTHDTKAEAAAAPANAGAGPGGIKAWIPLILTLVLMPVLAFAMTQFVLLPKLTIVMGRQANPHGENADTQDPDAAGAHGADSPADAAHGGGAPAADGHGAAAAKPATGAKFKEKIPLSKLVVNVSGSLGTRLLLCSVTLAGNAPEFKTVIENNTDMLRDLASSVLAIKTIEDLEKPDSRNLIRAELLSQFNASLGRNMIQEIYITELAVQ